MRWSALKWLAVIMAVVMMESNWARAAPNPRNEDMFRDLLKLEQMYSSLARPRMSELTRAGGRRSGPISTEINPKVQRANILIRLQELDRMYAYKARPRVLMHAGGRRSGYINAEINRKVQRAITLLKLQELDRMYAYIARPRFGKRGETNSNFAPVDYEGQFQNDDAGDWLPVRR